jgi:hypothetical protein
MPRLVLILCGVLVYVGCGSRREPAGTLPDPGSAHRGGTIRVVLPDGPAPCESWGADSLGQVFLASLAGNPGPFVLDVEARAATPDPTYPGTVRPDRVAWIESPPGGPEEPLHAGEADVGVVYGSAAGTLAEAGFSIARLRTWDRTYALWFDVDGRWVGDPNLRAWIGRRIDRRGMLEYLFAGEGSPATRLLEEDESDDPIGDAGRRPVSAAARPRLGLAYDPEDRYATVIASRIKAELENEGFHIALSGAARPLEASATAGRPPSIVLLAHQPPTADPAAGLERTFRCLGPGASDARAILDTATAAADDVSRSRIVAAAEDALLRDARLVPLIRLPAWLVTRDGLEGVAAGPPGVLRLTDAGWSR